MARRLPTVLRLGLPTVSTLRLPVSGPQFRSLLPRIVRSLRGPFRVVSTLGTVLGLFRSPSVGLPGMGGPQVGLFARLLVGLLRRRLLRRGALVGQFGGHLLSVGQAALPAGWLALSLRELLACAGLAGVTRLVAGLAAVFETVAASPRLAVSRPLLAAGSSPVVRLLVTLWRLLLWLPYLLALRLPASALLWPGLLVRSAVSRRRGLLMGGPASR